MGNKYWLVAVLVAWGKYGWLSSIRRTTCLPLKHCPVYAHRQGQRHTNTNTSAPPACPSRYTNIYTDPLPTSQGHTGTGKDAETQLYTQTHTNMNANTRNTCLPLKHSSQAHRQIHRQTQTPVAAAYPQSQGNKHRQRQRQKHTHTYIITDGVQMVNKNLI